MIRSAAWLRKVQYPELRKEMSSDFAVFKTMGAQIKQMASGYDLMWVVEERLGSLISS